MTSWTCTLAALLLIAPCLGAVAEPGFLPAGWSVFNGRILPDTFRFEGTGDSSNRDEKSNPATRDSQRMDMKDWLNDSQGLRLPANATAFYDASTSSVIVIAPKEIVEQVRKIFELDTFPKQQIVRLTATLVEFESEDFWKIRDLPYARLRSVAGATWKEIEEFALVAKSGQRATMSHNQGDDAAADSAGSEDTNPAVALKDGSSIEVEPVIGADGSTIDLNYRWTRRDRTHGKEEEFDAMSSATLKDGVPLVVSRWPMGTSKPKCRALVFRAERIDSSGKRFREAFSAPRTPHPTARGAHIQKQ